MRRLVFNGEDKVHRQVFVGLLAAWKSVDPHTGAPLIPLFTSPDSVRFVIEVNDALQELVKQSGKEVELVESGGELQLDDAAFDLLRNYWNAYRRFMPSFAAKDVLEVDSFLSTALTGKAATL